MANKMAEDGNAGPKRKRLASDERRRDILEKAIRFFAQNGMASSTRELARELGVTQPLLYRYFPSKSALIAEVYETVYLRRWRPEWDAVLADRDRPLRERLIDFYDAYTQAIFEPEWMRIFIYSGLMGEEINRNYVRLVHERILRPMVVEFHAERGVSGAEPAIEEIEVVWTIHGGIFYRGVRQVVFEAPMRCERMRAIENAVDMMLMGLDHLRKKAPGA